MNITQQTGFQAENKLTWIADPDPQWKLPPVMTDALDPSELEIVIVGATAAGKTFRPSDWAERLCGMMSIFGQEQKLSYSPYLKPVLSENVKCVVVDVALRHIDAEAFRFLMDFVLDNELTLRSGRIEPRPEPGDATVRAA